MFLNASEFTGGGKRLVLRNFTLAFFSTPLLFIQISSRASYYISTWQKAALVLKVKMSNKFRNRCQEYSLIPQKVRWLGAKNQVPQSLH